MYVAAMQWLTLIYVSAMPILTTHCDIVWAQKTVRLPITNLNKIKFFVSELFTNHLMLQNKTYRVSQFNEGKTARHIQNKITYMNTGWLNTRKHTEQCVKIFLPCNPIESKVGNYIPPVFFFFFFASQNFTLSKIFT